MFGAGGSFFAGGGGGGASSSSVFALTAGARRLLLRLAGVAEASGVGSGATLAFCGVSRLAFVVPLSTGVGEISAPASRFEFAEGFVLVMSPVVELFTVPPVRGAMLVSAEPLGGVRDWTG